MFANYFPMQVRLMVGLLKAVGSGDQTTADGLFSFSNGCCVPFAFD
jgi:hypothetical protein